MAHIYGICTTKHTNCEYKRFKNMFMAVNFPIPCKHDEPRVEIGLQ